MTRIARAIAVLVSSLAVALAVSATPAQAHTQWGCNHGSSCVFTGYDGSGNKYTIIWSTTPKNTCVNLPAGYQDSSSSLVSDFGSGWDIRWWENAGCSDLWGGDYHYAGTAWSLDRTRTHLDNDVQSFQIVNDL